MKNWESVKLGDLYEVHNGLSKGGKFFGSGYPFLTFSTVFNNYFLPEELTDFVQSTEKENSCDNRNRAFGHLPRHAKPRRALLDRLRRRTSRGAFIARTASQAYLQHGGLRGILKRKGRTRGSALCGFFPGPYRNDSPCAARRSRPAVTPSFTAAGIATPE